MTGLGGAPPGEAPEDAPTSDAVLWKRASRGDRDAFGVLFQRHMGAVWNHGYRLTGSWERAEDLTSAVFLTAWRKRASVVLVRDSALPWLFTAMGNLARDERRGLLRRWRLARRVGPPAAADDHADAVVRRVDDQARVRAVAEAVAGLPRAQRRAVELCLVGGLGSEAAAEVLGVSAVTVRTNLSRARAHLRDELKGS